MEQTIIDRHADDALKVIANAAAEASKVIATAAAEAIKVKGSSIETSGGMDYSRDHDLIQRMDEKLDNLSKDFKDLRDGTAERLKRVEEGKASEAEVDRIYTTRNPQWKDYSGRIESLENWKNWVLGIFTLIGIIMALVVYIYLHDLSAQNDQMKDVKTMLQQHVIGKE